MPDQTPSFDNSTIAKIALDLYGIEGKISALASFEDQNALIKAPGGSYVLKIANKRWAVAGLGMQTAVFEYLNTVAPDLCVPRTIPSKAGDTVTVHEGFSVRLLTFLEGDLFGGAVRSPELYRNLGNFMGRFTQAMQGFSHPAAHRPADLWSLDNVLACKAFLPNVIDGEVRARIDRAYGNYEKEVQPKLKYLRKAVLHNDANEQNILVDVEGTERIVGLIDFGDMEFATLINELAIVLAYALLDEDEVDMAARAIIQGYTQEFLLEEGELDVVFDLVTMRLVQSIINSSTRAKEFPDNAYILISQKPAIVLLEKLEGGLGFDASDYLLRRPRGTCG